MKQPSRLNLHPRLQAISAFWVDRLHPFLIFPLLLVVFFSKMVFTNLILARGDTFLYFYPYWHAAAEALRNGRLPLWNPDLFMGSPLLANSQMGFFYPLNWPLWLLFRTPYAVNASILLHLFIAGCGAYWAGRRCLGLGRSASTVTAVAFALSGYLTAQVEHINQLQGLAWLPFCFVVLHTSAEPGSHLQRIGRGGLALGVLLALQLLAGHTQTAFITGVGLLIWSGAQIASHFLLQKSPYALTFTFFNGRFRRRAPLVMGLGVLTAVLLAAVQLLPTLELAGLSSRQTGLAVNEVLSFSLHPVLLARSLLPAYGQSLFSEYIAFFPVTLYLVAFIGAWQWRQWRGVLPAVALVLVGLFLALGVFNPANWLIARLPGFDLFRVPARWLVLSTLGVSLLAGLGWQIVLDRWLVHSREWAKLPPRAQEQLWHIEEPLRFGLYAVVGLVMWGSLAMILNFFIPTGAEAPYEAPNVATVLLLNGELILMYLWLSGQRVRLNGRWRLGFDRVPFKSPYLMAGVAVLFLFAATRTHPYNHLTTPEAYFDLRPPTTRLQGSCLGQVVCGRFLSLSNIFFDPGDQGEIASIYQDQLPADALYDYTVAIKSKEIVAPNLPLVVGLPSVDGFDGGILPLKAYSQLMRLILPDGQETTDGRLREHLTALPVAKWLDLFNTQFLITDKTGDVWRDVGAGKRAYFDLQNPVTLQPGEQVEVAYVPPFTATAVFLVASGEIGTVEATAESGERWEIIPFAVESGLVRAAWPTDSPRVPFRPARLQTLRLTASASGAWQIFGLTLVNEQDGTFQSFLLGDYRLIHSGDVKVYQNLAVTPRAFLVYDWDWAGDVAGALAKMQEAGFDGRQTAVLLGAGEPPTKPGTGQVTITSYEPEQIVLQAETDQAAVLVLSDAFYPGWQATVDGIPVPIYQTDVLFRSLQLSSGTHQVVFVFAPASVRNGRLVTLGTLTFVLLGAFWLWRTS